MEEAQETLNRIVIELHHESFDHDGRIRVTMAPRDVSIEIHDYRDGVAEGWDRPHVQTIKMRNAQNGPMGHCHYDV